MQRKICATAWCALNADAQIKAEHCSYQHYSKALRHDICQEACCKVWPHHQEHIQVKYCCPHTLWGSTLSQLLFNQEVMFVTALGKLMAPFPHRRKKKKKKRGRYNIPHTLMHLDVVVRRGRWGQGSWIFLFLHYNFTSVLSTAEIHPTPCFKKVGSKWMT